MFKRYSSVLFILIFFALSNPKANSQEAQKSYSIKLEGCISIALDKNYSIKIASNNLLVAKNNLSYSQFLPELNLSSKYNSTNYNSLNNTNSNSANLSWRIFDGFSMFAERETQKALLSQGENSFKSSIEQLVMQISTHYYLIISLQNQVNLLKEVTSISLDRYNQALTRYKIGKDSGLEYKQAKIYLNSDSSKLLLQEESVRNAYIDLFKLMNVPFDSQYVINDTIIPDPNLNLENLLSQAESSNTTLKVYKAGERVADANLKIAKSQLFPTIDLTAGYSLFFSKVGTSQSPFEKSEGPTAGISVSIPIFKGFDIAKKISNARLGADNSKLEYNIVYQDIKANLIKEFNSYQNNLKMITFEIESKESAFLNLEAAMEKYRLGSLSGIEFRDFQLSYLDASVRKLNALYQTKLSEIYLQLLAGNLFNLNLYSSK